MKKILIVSFIIFVWVIALFDMVYAEQLSFAWDHDAPDTVDEYMLYLRTEGQSYNYQNPAWRGIEQTGSIDNLLPNTKYYVVARARDGDITSANSEELEFTIPTSPKNLKITITIDINVGG